MFFLPTLYWDCKQLLPIGSMYGIFTYIYHKNQLNVGKYTIHGSYGLQGSLLNKHDFNGRVLHSPGLMQHPSCRPSCQPIITGAGGNWKSPGDHSKWGGIYFEIFFLFFLFFFFLFLVPWSPGPLIPWCPGHLVPLHLVPSLSGPQCPGPLVPWSSGPLVPWSPGPLVLWSPAPLVPWSSVLFRSFFSNLSFTLFYYQFYIFTLSCVC